MQVPSKGIIYYTDCELEEPIFSIVQECILDSILPIISVSLNKPIDFGYNLVLKGKRGYPTMVDQIVMALQESNADYVFFCEHDVLYSDTHFKFLPPRDDTYYYNTNNWRWDYPKDRLIRYDGLSSLSQMCCNRELALKHFRLRQAKIAERSEEFTGREPARARIWGYEPGTKKPRNGGFSDEKSDRWSSYFPNIDIRHKHTFSPPKTSLDKFKHLPTGWTEATIDEITSWDLRGLFNL